MDDQARGGMDKAGGNVKEGVGRAIDDPQLQAEGEADQAKGDLKQKVGDAKEKIGDAVDDLKDRNR